MSADPTLQAALGQSVVTMVLPVRFGLPSRPLCLIDGAGEVAFDAGHGVETFVGLDAEFGAMGTIEQVSGGADDEAPELEMTLLPADGVAAATLASPAMQGAEALFFIGAVDPMTGAVIGEPYLLFMGEVDVPTLSSQLGERSVAYSVISVFDRLIATDESVRATDGWLKSVWPGAKGLEFMTGTTETLYWGGKPASYDTTNYAPASYAAVYRPYVGVGHL